MDVADFSLELVTRSVHAFFVTCCDSAVEGQIVYLFPLLPILPLTLRRLMSYIYGAPILDVSRSHTTTQHSR